jgi:23S rRNA (cytosine1962-C5)-methyltransferase
VVNVDFAESSLKIGGQKCPHQCLADPAPLPEQRRVRRRAPASPGCGQGEAWCAASACRPFPALDKQQFDLVFLDPPRYAKSPFGVVDVVNDYPALFKPALLCHRRGRHADLLPTTRRKWIGMPGAINWNAAPARPAG